MGLPPILFLTFSIFWSIKTALKTHFKAVMTEKGFLPFASKVFTILWALFATVRRIAGIVAFFAPSLGLFDFLFHWKYEQKPFK